MLCLCMLETGFVTLKSSKFRYKSFERKYVYDIFACRKSIIIKFKFISLVITEFNRYNILKTSKE